MTPKVSFPLFFHFLALFCHFCPCPAWGRFPFRFPFFFPFPAFGRFPCHTSPAGSQPKTPNFRPEKRLKRDLVSSKKVTFGVTLELHMGKKRDDLASFSVLCFLALGGHCLQMLCFPGFWTHANTQNLPHFRALPASIRELSPPKCLLFMANKKTRDGQIFPGLPVYIFWSF